MASFNKGFILGLILGGILACIFTISGMASISSASNDGRKAHAYPVVTHWG